VVYAGSLDVKETPGVGRTVIEADEDQVEQDAREAAQVSICVGKEVKLTEATLVLSRRWWTPMDSEPIVLKRSLMFAEGANIKYNDAMDFIRGSCCLNSQQTEDMCDHSTDPIAVHGDKPLTYM
jgi:hypothetical protein